MKLIRDLATILSALVVAVASIAVFAPAVHAAPGDLDPLNPALVGNYVLATAVQPDGKIILAGKFTSVFGVARNNLARLNADGALDTTFNPNPNGDVNSVAVQPDGKILLGGSFTNVVATTRNRIARLNADGTLDTGFDPNANGSPMSIVLQADGKVLLGGDFTAFQPNGAASATTRNRLARLNGDGTLDTAFNPNANDRVVSMALQADGKILISGYFLTLQPNGAASATTRNRIARLHADGTLDTAFDPNANHWVLGIAVQADGRVVLGGYFTTLQPNGAASATARNCVARVNADGTLDTIFDPRPNNALFGLGLQADGKVLLGGLFSTLQPNGAGSATARNLFARVVNDPATSTVYVTSSSQVLWTRSGSAPEVSRVTFELSTNSGATWTPLGNGTRVGSTGNWQLTGLSLPSTGIVRARGATTHGYFNGSSGLVESSASFSPPPTDAVAWLKAEGNALDATSHANNGVVNGSVPYVAGQVGNAFGFNGNTANHVRIPNSASLQTAQMSVEYWVYFNSAHNAVTVAKRNGSSDAWQAGITYSGGNFNLQFVGQSADWYSAPLASPVGVWTHVAATYDGSTVRGYINGAQLLTRTVALQLGSRTSDIYVGGYAGTSLPFDGKVDEISIYNRALSAAEVQAVHVTGPGGKSAFLLPTVTSVSPSGGSTSGGTSVTITGTNLTGATGVTFGGNPATGVTVVNPTTITATTPAGNAGTASVVVTTPGGSNAANSLFTYVTPPPTVTGVSPASGSTAGGTTLTITGTNLTGATGVTIGGVAASGVTVVNATTITATTPAGAAGTASVVVTTAGGSNGTNAWFTYASVNAAPGFSLPVPVGDGSAAWTPTESSRDWSAIASSADGSKLVAAAFNGQIYTSTDSGATWTPRESARRWTSVASSADGVKLAAVAINGQIYTSTDSGVTWTARDSGRFWMSIASSADGSKLVAAAYNGQIYTSTDSGVTWTAREANRYWKAIASSADGSKLAAVVDGGQIYTSTDSGVTWTARESGRSWMSIASSADGSKLAAVADNQQIRISTDGGVTWTARESNRAWMSIASSADGTRLAAAVNGMQIQTSVDGGATWTARESNRPWFAITSSADGGKLAAAGYGDLIYLSPRVPYDVAVEISPQTVSMAGFAMGITPGPAAEAAQTVTFEVTNDQPSLFTIPPAISSDGTLTFRLGTTPGVATVTVIAHDNGGTALGGIDTSAPQTFTITALPPVARVTGVSPASGPVEGGTAVVISGTALDGATAVTFGGTSAASFTVVDHTTIQATTPAHLVGAVSVEVSTPVGNTAANSFFTYTAQIAPVFTLPYEPGDLSQPWTPRGGVRVWASVATSADGAKMAAVEYGGQIHTSTDHGVTWTARESVRDWIAIASSADGSRLVALVHGGQIHVSTDSGATWTPREQNRNWYRIAATPNGARLAAAVESGAIYFSDDGGTTWEARYGNHDWSSLAYSADGFHLAATALVDYVHLIQGDGAYGSPAWSLGDHAWQSVASSANGSYLAVVPDHGYIYTSDNGGWSWAARRTDAMRNWRSITASADGSRLAAAEYGGQIHTSADGGVTWTARESNRNWWFLTSFADGRGLAGIADGQIFISAPGTYDLTHPARSGPATIANFATNVSPGPAAEAWQAVTFEVTNDNPALFTIQPSIASDGTLTFTPGNSQGTANVTVIARDNGSNLLGNVNTSAPQTFTLTLTAPVPNVAPAFTLRDLPAAPATAWTPRESDRYWPSIASSADGRKLAAGTVDGVFLSADGGATWTSRWTGTSIASTICTSITSSLDGTRLATWASPYLLISTDSGDTWQLQHGLKNATAIAASADGMKLAASGNVIRTSTDGGITWTEQTGPENTTGIASSADGTKLAAVVPVGAIFTSTDSGVAWTARMTDVGRNWKSIASSADGSKLAAVVNGGGIFTSIDGGVSWTERMTDADRAWASITSSADGNTLAAVVNGGRIYVSADGGVSWTAQESDRTWTCITASEDGGKLAAADEFGRVYTSPRIPLSLTVQAGSGPSSVANVAEHIRPGPAIEAWQSVAFQVTNDNNALFATQPAVSSDGTLTFTPGSSAGVATVTVIAHDNGGTDFGGADTSAAQTFTITVTPSPIGSWRQTHFGSSDDSGNAADDFDFDHDGLVNLLEYAFGLNPTQPDAGSMPRFQRVGNELVISFTTPPGVSGITYGAQSSATLAPDSWQPVPDTGTPPNHEFKVAVGAKTKDFVRLTVTGQAEELAN